MEVRAGIEVRGASPADVPPLTATLAAAFQDDAVMRWWIGDDEERAAVLPRFFSFAVEHQWLRHGEVHVAGDAEGGAAWAPPGRWRPPQDALAEIASGYFASIGQRHFDRGGVILSMVEERHPSEPHWYLPFIGVRPDRQGRGIGSTLLAHMEARLDAEGLPAYLEASSERNRALYLRHGFEVTEEFVLPDDGPPLWRMWREPSRP
jgi:ribosomal protein S18 acetylase RimI-like enzyme